MRPPAAVRCLQFVGRKAWEAIGRHAAANGYRVVKNGSKKGNALFRCAKGRIYKSKANSEVHESKRRKTSSQFTGCPFKFKAKPLPNGQWALKVPEGIAHNHGRNEETAFAASRAEKLKPLEQEVIELANKGVRPAQILGKIHADELGILGKDIHNLLQRHRRGELKGRSPLQALYEDHLTSQGSLFVWKDTRDAQNRVTSLTIAPKTGLELLKQNSDLLLLDATYKTNCHNMPMFNACGVTHCNKVFSWAVTFISGEQESHYQVALEHQISILEDEGIPKPGVIVSDRELALLKALNKSGERSPRGEYLLLQSPGHSRAPLPSYSIQAYYRRRPPRAEADPQALVELLPSYPRTGAADYQQHARYPAKSSRG